MRNVFLFMMVSLDGFYNETGGGFNRHYNDSEFNTFAVQPTTNIGWLSLKTGQNENARTSRRFTFHQPKI